MADATAGRRTRDRILAVSAATALAAATTVGLTHFRDRARGPLEDLEAMLVTQVEALARRLREDDALAARRQSLSTPVLERELERLRRGAQPLVGIWDPRIQTSLSDWQEIERKFETRFHLIGVYVGWTREASGSFPHEAVERIWEAGSVPILTWEPWVHALDAAAPPDGRDCLKDIAAGRYDEYVDVFAAGAARFDRPLFLRFAHEMNDPYRYPWGPAAGNQPEDFVAAYRHVRQRFERAGAHAVSWVFAPSIAYRGLERYYPGADVVDWSASAVLNYGTTARWSRWWSLDELLAPGYAELARLKHPIMLAETASARHGGDPRSWYEAARATLTSGKYPAVRALVLFHDANDKTLGAQPVDFSADDDATRPAVAGLLRAFQDRR